MRLPSFESRADLVELMDRPDCPTEPLLRTVDQFASINRLVSRYRHLLTRWVLTDMAREPGRDYHLIDMGAGGCDIGVWLLRVAAARGLKLRITACDSDPRIVAHAHDISGSIPGLTILEADLLDPASIDQADYVFANHFLHHLKDDQIVDLLQNWTPQVRRRLIFGDIERSAVAYIGFGMLSLAYRDSFVRPDGLTSIQRGFRASELMALANDAGLSGRTTVHRLPLFRLALVIHQESQPGL